MARIECLAVDLDGTLTDERGVIHHEVVEVLERLRERGVKVLIVTCATYPAAVTLAYYLPVTRLAVAECGGVVGFRGDYRLLAPPEDKQAILDVARRELKGVLVESWQNLFRFVDVAFHPAPGVERADALRAAARAFEPLGFEVLDSGWAIHVHRRGVDKARGLRAACEILGVDPQRVAAIGDSEVDGPMFDVAAVSVALGNSPPQLRARATFAVGSGYYLGFLEAVKILEGKGLL